MFIRWNPYHELRRLQHLQHQMNNLFDNQYEQGEHDAMPTCDWRPVVDVYEDTERFVLTAELPGVEPSQVDLRVEQNQLTLKGERKLEREDQRENYHRIELNYGTFTRSFSLPATVDAEKIRAESKNGVLTVVLPKKAEAKPRSIQVKVS